MDYLLQTPVLQQEAYLHLKNQIQDFFNWEQIVISLLDYSLQSRQVYLISLITILFLQLKVVHLYFKIIKDKVMILAIVNNYNKLKICKLIQQKVKEITNINLLARY